MNVLSTQTKSHQKHILKMIDERGFQFSQTMLKDCLQALIQQLMDIEVSQVLDASRYERNSTRRVYRNGYRTTIWQTPIGNINLRIPKLRRGTYYPDRLINDTDIVDTLVDFIKLSILTGVDADNLADELSELELMPLSLYNIHQLCDVLRDTMTRNDESATNEIEVDVLSIDSLSWNNRKYLLLMSRRNLENKLEIVETEETSRLDNEFWQDFTRRMSQAGLMVESNQPILASINPYASMQLIETHHSIHPNFARYIHSLYEENEFQAIA